MAQPSHINYPESKTHAKELAAAQANVYKVKHSKTIEKYPWAKILHRLQSKHWLMYCLCISDNARMLESGTIQASNLWVPYTYVWRFQYYDSKSIHGIILRMKNIETILALEWKIWVACLCKPKNDSLSWIWV